MSNTVLDQSEVGVLVSASLMIVGLLESIGVDASEPTISVGEVDVTAEEILEALAEMTGFSPAVKE